jgi:CNT family concentrative nucleoside transporter
MSAALPLLAAVAAEAGQAAGSVPFAQRALSFFGLFVMIGLAWLLSTNRRRVRWRPVIWGVALQILLGLLILNPALQGFFFDVVDAGVRRLLSFAEAGADFVFQSVEPHQIMNAEGEAVTFVGRISPPVKTFAFWILPTIIFFSSLMAILYHLGIMQRVVWAVAWVMQRTMRTSGAESLSAAANIFVGQTEAPLVVRPFVERMTRSELMAVMTAGFATVAGGVMAAYVSFLRDIPGIAGHLVTASLLSAPAALAIAKIMVPEDGEPETAGTLEIKVEKTDRNVIEAAANGAATGVKLAINVAAMLIAFVGLIALVDFGLGLIPTGGDPLTLSRIFGWVFAPLAFAMGIPWEEAPVVGRLLGEKIVLTEFIAYINLGGIMSGPNPLSPRSAIIASYALCGFANFASIGIQLGGIGGIAPSRMGDLAALGLRAMIGGSLAAFMTATIAGILLG